MDPCRDPFSVGGAVRVHMLALTTSLHRIANVSTTMTRPQNVTLIEARWCRVLQCPRAVW